MVCQLRRASSYLGFWLQYTVADIGGGNIALWFGEGFLVSQYVLAFFDSMYTCC